MISTALILNKVKAILHSFASSDLLDDTLLLEHADWVISQLGRNILKDFSTILDVYNYKGITPFNLKEITSVEKCRSVNPRKTKNRYYLGSPITYNIHDDITNICYDKCCYEETSQRITRTFYIEEEKHEEEYCDREFLSLHPDVPKDCLASDCKNRYCKSEHNFNFDLKSFYFNFEEGSVALKYKGVPLDDEGYPMVEDEPIIVKAIEDYLIYKSFQHIYYNGDADVQQRMQYAEQAHKVSLSEARWFTKLTPLSEWKEFQKKRDRGNQKLNLSSNADFNKSKEQQRRKRLW